MMPSNDLSAFVLNGLNSPEELDLRSYNGAIARQVSG